MEYGRLWPQANKADLDTLENALIAYCWSYYQTDISGMTPEELAFYQKCEAAAFEVIKNPQAVVKMYCDAFKAHPNIEFVWDDEEEVYNIEWSESAISQSNAETVWGLLFPFIAKISRV